MFLKVTTRGRSGMYKKKSEEQRKPGIYLSENDIVIQEWINCFY
jgi:hypothetical protein